jgi:hypothetical protein
LQYEQAIDTNGDGAKMVSRKATSPFGARKLIMR